MRLMAAEVSCRMLRGRPSASAAAEAAPSAGCRGAHATSSALSEFSTDASCR